MAGEKEKYTVYKLKLSNPGSVRTHINISPGSVRILKKIYPFPGFFMLFLTMILPLVQVPSTWFLHRRYSDFLTLRATLIKVVIITIILFIVIIIIFIVIINIFTIIIVTKTRIRSLQV